jgi:hypothetical protein
MQGTVRMCLELGYTPEQAELIGQIDDLFEEAVKLELCSGEEAEMIGQKVGLIFGRHTGKLS